MDKPGSGNPLPTVQSDYSHEVMRKATSALQVCVSKLRATAQLDLVDEVEALFLLAYEAGIVSVTQVPPDAQPQTIDQRK